ncbi:GAS2-like protein 2A isoform X2 [Narcine bancroftii]|uniref:GAS2-like protein 2A isoform X2 n=1 Tax=Narcine bancroftii TaxID=1343680 RepID=UPI0038312B6E
MASIQSATSTSIRPFKSSEEYVVAMKEDLAEWLNQLYGLDTGLEQLMRDLETGGLLCFHANHISRLAHHSSHLKVPIALPQAGVSYAAAAQPGTFQARVNVSNFIQWCRKELQIQDVLMFETEDLVLRKNEKNVVLCLLEVARRASKLGMLAPVLIQMEEEIEEEIREEMDLPAATVSPKPKSQKQLCDFKNLDEMILRNHVMVRVGGGWDTLQHYLDKHDPCRCTSLTHKQASRFSSPQRSAMPMHEIKARLPSRTEQPNKPQAALILSRSQSPMPPMEWRITVPNAPSLRSHNAALRPPSPDVPTFSGINSAKRNLWDKSELRQIFQTRQRDGLSMPVSVDSCKANSSITAARTGREKIRTLPIASKPNFGAQESRRSVVPAMESKKEPGPPGFPQRSDGKMSRTWINNQCADSKTDQSILDVNKQSTRALSQAQKPALETSSVISKGLSLAPGQQCGLSVTPGAGRKSERDQTTLQLLTPRTARQEAKSTRKPTPDGSKKPNPQRSPIQSVTPDLYNLNNKGVNNACLFTPVSINTAQESELNRGFEDEIVSNIKALEMCLIEESEAKKCSSAAREASFPKQKEAQRFGATCSSQFSMSPFQLAANHDHHTKWPPGGDTEASLPPVKPAQSGGGFSNPVAELVSGPPSLSHMGTQKWVAKSSREMMPPRLSYTEESSKTFPTTPEDQRDIEIGSICDQKSHTLKDAMRRDVVVSQNKMTVLELNSISTNEGSDTNSSFDWPGPPCTPHRTKVQHERQKRSLRKPERVPSIYKLKLRPKIRPRWDNRPEKKPSRIPTPLSYREEDKKLKGTSKSASTHLPLKANSKVVRSKVQGKQKSFLYLTQTKDPGSEEDSWPSQLVNRAQDRSSKKQSITDDDGQGNEEESWV